MKKICKYCGKEFEAANNHAIYCNATHYVKCPICGKIRKVKKDQLKNILVNGPTCCSYECRAKRTQQTSIKKYGCKAPGNNPDARKKASETMMIKLGVPYAMMSKEVKTKAKDTLLERYGVDNIAKSKIYLEKRMETAYKRYGGTLPFNRKECYDKQHETILKRYGVKYATELPWVKCWKGHVSNINKSFGDKLAAMSIEYEFERCITTKYYDIEITGSNILIEIDPTYTHSSMDHHNMQGLYPNYHRDKTELAKNTGYKCIHIWDWDDQDKIIKQIAPKLKLNISDFAVYRLSDEAVDSFLVENDIHGKCRGKLLSLGLVKDGEIYQIIVFGKSKFNTSFDIQILRICTRLGYEIEEGYNVLSDAASRIFFIDKCIAYVDKSKLYNDEFEKMGMKLDHSTPPAKIWSKGTKFIANRLVQIPGSQFSESQLIQDNWLPIYDCGQDVYTFE